MAEAEWMKRLGLEGVERSLLHENPFMLFVFILLT